MLVYIDIDDTLCSPISKKDSVEEIKNCKPYTHIIKLVRELYNRGHKIVLYTHRAKNCHKETEKWLKKHKVPYNTIKYQKPKWDILIDNLVLPPWNFLTAKIVEGYVGHIKKWNFDKGKFNRRKRDGK